MVTVPYWIYHRSVVQVTIRCDSELMRAREGRSLILGPFPRFCSDHGISLYLKIVEGLEDIVFLFLGNLQGMLIMNRDKNKSREFTTFKILIKGTAPNKICHY